MQIHISLLHSISATPRVRLASSLLRKRQRRQSHIFYDCSSSQCPGNLARLPPQSLAQAARAQHHTGQQMDLAQQFGLTNLPTLPSLDFLFQTRACGTSTKQRKSYVQRRHCRGAPNSTTLAPARRHERTSSSLRHEGLLIDVLGGRAARTSSSPGSVLNWRPVLTLDKPRGSRTLGFEARYGRHLVQTFSP